MSLKRKKVTVEPGIEFNHDNSNSSSCSVILVLNWNVMFLCLYMCPPSWIFPVSVTCVPYINKPRISIPYLPK